MNGNAHLPRRNHLMTPAQLAERINLSAASEALVDQWRVLEVGFGALPAFLNAHIPGARYLDTLELETAPLWNKVSDAALEAALLRHGIRHDSTVILYGRNNLAAARAAHLMLYAGVADVRLLDGGYAAWCAQGWPSEAGGARGVVAATGFGAVVPVCPEYMLDMDAARRLQAHDATQLVSVRTWNEFVGRTSGYSYIAARGEIPGALWGRIVNDDDIDGMSEFHTVEGGMAHPRQIRQIWDAAGIDPARHTVFYCGTGWRAALAFFYAWLMGWEHIAVFDGGWCEWSLDPANPVLCRLDAEGV